MTFLRFACVGLAVLLAGCSSEEPADEAPAEGQWLGQMASSDAWVALSAEDGRVAAYVCGGPSTLETHTRWWSGDAAADLSLVEDGWTFAATLAAGSIDGTLTDADGHAEDFSLVERPDGGLAGLFTGFDSGCRAGVIVLGDGSVQGAWCNSEGLFAQVTPVMPVSLDGFEVMADTAIGERTFDVELVVPAEVTP